MGKKGILCIGKMQKYILLITLDFWVYELPLTSINHTINQLYLGDTKPQPISTKWPTLYNDAYYQKTLKVLYDAYTAVDSKSEYVIFVTKVNTAGGVTYDIGRNSVGGPYLLFKGSMHGKHVVTSDSLVSYYAIIVNTTVLRIRRWIFCCDHQVATSIPCTTQVGPDCKTEHTSDTYDNFYRLCKHGSDQLYIERDPKKSCKPINWPIYNGFVDRGKIYLLGSNYMFTFPERAYTHPGEKATYLGVPFNNFIRCHGEVHGRALEVTKSKLDHIDGAEPL